MKILLASFLYETEIGGGAAVALNQLAQMLVQKNHDVVVLTTWAARGQVKTENVNGIKIIRLPASNLYWIADKDRQSMCKKIFWQLIDIWNPLTYRLTREVIMKEIPDIMHSHKLRGLSPSIWSAAASAGVKKIVHTCHDYELLSPEGLLMGRVGKLAREQNLVMRPYQSIRRSFSRLVNTVTAPSRYVMDLHQEFGYFPLAKRRMIPNTHGFDANEVGKDYDRSRFLPKEDGGLRFLYIGRLDKVKGVDLLCQAFLQFAGQHQDSLLRIAGWGPLDEALREKYAHRKNIEFTGTVFGDQKVDLFKNSDILVAPSIAPESFGIVITEAYFYGLPVIATKVGAYSEIVIDGETGILVKPGSVEELLSAFSRMAEEKNLLRTMSRNCLKEALKYTTGNYIENYLAVYENGGW